jgi:hypothetical protein
MFTVPAATGVMAPCEFTVAIVPLLEFQATVRPVSTLFAASRAVAVAVTLCPTVAVLTLSETATEATGATEAETTVTFALAE